MLEAQEVNTEVAVIAPMKAKVYRNSQTKYQMSFSEWFAELNPKEIISLTQSESDGNVSITIIYR